MHGSDRNSQAMSTIDGSRAIGCISAGLCHLTNAVKMAETRTSEDICGHLEGIGQLPVIAISTAPGLVLSDALQQLTGVGFGGGVDFGTERGTQSGADLSRL